MFICKYCNKEYVTNNAGKNHEIKCPSNADRIYTNGMTGKKGTNHYAKGAKMTEETKNKISKSSKGKILSDETKQKLSKIRTQYMINNSDKLRRKKSYMEISFSAWLQKFNIDFLAEVHFRNNELNKSYFVDFLFEDKKIIIELDGNQHEKRQVEDNIRDDFFKKLGYTVIRIKHAEYISKLRVNEIKTILLS